MFMMKSNFQNKICSIYKATNLTNGKSYIGFDSAWPNRKNHHLKLYTIQHSLLQQAIKKYGPNNFSWEVICQSKDGLFLLQEMENYFIKQYDTRAPNGYNMTEGGLGSRGIIGKTRTLEARKKMSVKRRARVTKESTREKLRELGIINSDELNKRTAAWKNRVTWKITSPEKQEFTITNLRDFCRRHKLTAPLMIQVANKTQTHHKGYKCERVLISTNYK